MVELRVVSSLFNGNEEGEFFILLQETLEMIEKQGVDTDDIKQNVIFVFHNIPALTKDTDERSVIITFNLQKLKEDIEKSGDNFNERAKDIIAHEIAHYVIGNYNQISTEEIERATDDLSESWGFGRAYRDEPEET